MHNSSELMFKKAYYLYQQGQLNSAIELLRQTIDIASDEGNFTTACSTFGLMGEIYRQLNEIDSAQKCYENALSLARKSKLDISYTAIAIKSLGNIALDKGNKNEAHNLYNEALNLLDDKKEHPFYSLLLDEIAHEYYKKNDFHKSAEFVRTIIKLKEKINNIQGKADALKKLGLCERLNKNYEEALKCFEQSHIIAKSCNDIPTQIIALAEKGFTYATENNHNEAVKIFKEVSSLRKLINYYAGEETDRAALAHSLIKIGDIEEAMKNLEYNKKLKNGILSKEEKEDLSLCYFSINQTDKAIQILEDILEESNNESDKVWQARCLGNLGMIYKKNGELYKAKDRFIQALNLHKILGDADGEYLDYANLEDISKMISNTDNYFSEDKIAKTFLWNEMILATSDAEKTFKKMEEKAMQDRNPSLQAAALDYLGTIARNEGALEKAIYFYRKALVVCGKIADNGPPITAIRQFVTLNNLGIVYRMQNIFDKAEKCYIEAIELIRSKIGKDSLIELEPCINLIKLYLRNGKIENAEKVYSMMTHNISDDLHRLMDLDIQIEILDARRSDPTKLVLTIKELIKLSNKLGVFSREAYGWQKLGIIYQYDLNDLNEALVCFDHAINLLKRRDFQSQLADVLRDRAYARFELKNLDGAYKDITQALQLFEQKLNIVSGTFKKHQRLIKLNWYILAIQICIELDYIDQAIEYLERSRAQNLVSLLATRKIDFKPIIPKEICTRFLEAQSAHRNLDLLLQQEQQKPNNISKINQLHEQLEQQNNDINELLSEISKYDPTFPKIFRVKPIQFHEILDIIPDDIQTAIIQFLVCFNGIFVFIITRDRFPFCTKVFQTPLNTKNLNDLLYNHWFEPYTNFCQEKDQKAQQKFFDSSYFILNHLYNEIFAHKANGNESIDEYLKQKNIKRIIFIPHGILHTIPLHATYYKHNGETKYLVDSYEITYAPSCQILQFCLSSKSNQYNKFLAFANPDGSLPFAEMEANIIGSMFSKTQIFQREKATINNVLQFMSDADIVHFSCHGNFNFESPLDSCLKLSDDYLTLSKLFMGCNLKNGSLVNLSACESSLIRPDQTDEYVGLPSGFLFAGASCVLSSLWSVTDFSTYILMKRVFQNFQENKMSLLKSLQEAQIWLRSATNNKLREFLTDEIKTGHGKLINNILDNLIESIPFKHPYYWAAFQSIGFSW